jgi:hypothetical protein
MIAQTARDPWRVAWQIATSDYVIAILLLGIAAGLVITAWLPQMPVANPVAYARWLSETQSRFGNATTAIQALGLLTVTRSLGFRALLALLTGSLLLRLIEGGDRLRRHRETSEPAGEWYTLTDVHLSEATDDLRRQRYRVLGEHPLFQADRWPWGDLFPLLAHGGGLLLLIGLFVTHLWGWRVEGVVIQGSKRVTLPDTETWAKWDENTHDVTHSPGIVVLVEEQLPGIQVRADDGTGRPLSLQQTPDAEPVTRLTVALTGDQYFAIPEVQLIVRLAPHPNHVTEPHSPVLVQLYRSPPGRLVTETEVEGEARLPVDDVTLELTSVSYARLTAIFNPGLWPTGVGILLLAMGLLGSMAWPERRLWLREESERIETTGDPLPTLARNREV